MKYSTNAPTQGVPHLGSAIMPRMTRPAQAWNSRGQVSGSPGTTAIPIRGPEGVPHDMTAIASGGLYYSAGVPNVIYPSIYYENNRPKIHAPVSVKSDNQMPVPAKRAPNVILSDPFRARKGGQKQLKQPQVVQRFPGMYS